MIFSSPHRQTAVPYPSQWFQSFCNLLIISKYLDNNHRPLLTNQHPLQTNHQLPPTLSTHSLMSIIASWPKAHGWQSASQRALPRRTIITPPPDTRLILNCQRTLPTNDGDYCPTRRA
jgi:hypothetical protein